MRFAVLALAAVALLGTFDVAHAQSNSQRERQERNQRNRGQSPGEQQEERNGRREERPAPLRGNINAGPCPYVKILYDAARYVEMTGRATVANVGFTGEIEGVAANCSYQADEPITVDINLLFNLGRGPQAQGDSRTYRYWIAVTERNAAVLSKQYIDLPVDFSGQQTAAAEDAQTIVIPRASETVSGSNFEVLVGFDVSPEMAQFNRDGSRFRVNAGLPEAGAAPSQ